MEYTSPLAYYSVSLLYVAKLVCKVVDFTGKFACYRARTSCPVQQGTAAIAVVELWAWNPV